MVLVSLIYKALLIDSPKPQNTSESAKQTDWIILHYRSLQIYIPPTKWAHKVGVAPLDAMQAFKKGASFFSEPRRICFNSCFVSFLLFDHVTSHVDGVLSGFEKIIKESPWVN